MTKITLEQVRLLEPYGHLVHEMEARMEAMPTDELEKLRVACAAATAGNCWSCSFRAIQILLPVIRGTLSRRDFARKAMQEVS